MTPAFWDDTVLWVQFVFWIRPYLLWMTHLFYGDEVHIADELCLSMTPVMLLFPIFTLPKEGRNYTAWSQLKNSDQWSLKVLPSPPPAQGPKSDRHCLYAWQAPAGAILLKQEPTHAQSCPWTPSGYKTVASAFGAISDICSYVTTCF
jgi:hypothetical protein